MKHYINNKLTNSFYSDVKKNLQGNILRTALNKNMLQAFVALMHLKQGNCVL